MTAYAVMVQALNKVRQWWRERDTQWMDSTAERRQMFSRHTDSNMRMD